MDKNDFTVKYSFAIKNASMELIWTDYRAIALCKRFTVAFNSFLKGQFGGLPPVWQKNLLKLAFPAPKSLKGTLIQTSKTCAYLINNQLYMQCMWRVNSRFLIFKTAGTDFEFNKPILKKGAWICKDFEKNATDFEGFETDFEWILNRPAFIAAVGLPLLNKHRLDIFALSKN